MTLCTRCADQTAEDSETPSVEQIKKYRQALLNELTTQLITNMGMCDHCGHAWELNESEKLIAKATKSYFAYKKKRVIFKQ